jgi:hypothetical protein
MRVDSDAPLIAEVPLHDVTRGMLDPVSQPLIQPGRSEMFEREQSDHERSQKCLSELGEEGATW